MSTPLTPSSEAFLGAGTVNGSMLLYSAGVTLLLLFIGILLFNRIEATFMDTV